MRYFSLFLLLILTIATADERSVKITKLMQSEQRTALVIGNRDYTSLSPLSNPINDATAMRDILSKKGFDVIYLENASQLAIEDAIEQFAYKLKSGGVGLFYYAGHGIEVDGINYLIPTDARIPSKKFVKSKSVATDLVVSAMEEAKNRLNILILDSCRSNPFARSGQGGLAPLNSATGIYVAYATAPGKIAEDGSAGNGLFTRYLIRYINQAGLKIEDVFKKVRHDVQRDSGGQQIPWSSSSIYGDFYFTLPLAGELVQENSTMTPIVEVASKFTSSFDINPTDATVEIEGVDWYEGMKLDKGVYFVTVSKEGYSTKRFKIDLRGNSRFSVRLEQEKTVYQEPEIISNFSEKKLVKIAVVSGNYDRSYWTQHFSEVEYADTYSWAKMTRTFPFNSKMVIDLGLQSGTKENLAKHKNPSSILLRHWYKNKGYIHLNFKNKNGTTIHSFKFDKSGHHNSGYIEFDRDIHNRSDADLRSTIQGFIKVENNQLKFIGEYNTKGDHVVGIASKTWNMSNFKDIVEVEVSIGILHTYTKSGDARIPLYIEY